MGTAPIWARISPPIICIARRSALWIFTEEETSDHAKLQTVADFKNNRYDPSTDTLMYTAAQAHAFEQLRNEYGEFFGEPTTKYRLGQTPFVTLNKFVN